MYARENDGKVRLRWFLEDPVVYVKPFVLWDEALQEYDAHRTDLGTAQLAPYAEALEAAEVDVEDLFTLDLDVEHAEKIYAGLGRAILQAKISRGDFIYSDD